MGRFWISKVQMRYFAYGVEYSIISLRLWLEQPRDLNIGIRSHSTKGGRHEISDRILGLNVAIDYQ